MEFPPPFLKMLRTNCSKQLESYMLKRKWRKMKNVNSLRIRNFKTSIDSKPDSYVKSKCVTMSSWYFLLYWYSCGKGWNRVAHWMYGNRIFSGCSSWFIREGKSVELDNWHLSRWTHVETTNGNHAPMIDRTAPTQDMLL